MIPGNDLKHIIYKICPFIFCYIISNVKGDALAARLCEPQLGVFNFNKLVWRSNLFYK